MVLLGSVSADTTDPAVLAQADRQAKADIHFENSLVYGSQYAAEELPRLEMNEESMPAEAAYQLVHDELQTDGSTSLNLASFVTTYMEPNAEKLMMESMAKNIIDAVSFQAVRAKCCESKGPPALQATSQGTFEAENQFPHCCLPSERMTAHRSAPISRAFSSPPLQEEYPASQDISNRCVNMIARLFHAPVNNPEDESLGVSTIGSSEAIILATLAMKRKWQGARKAAGKPHDKPNLVMNSAVQVCASPSSLSSPPLTCPANTLLAVGWEKAARYLDIEEKSVSAHVSRGDVDARLLKNAELTPTLPCLDLGFRSTGNGAM
ncbi:hypothetical protein QFC19_005479 [Naganishia cerealis]|uniref:Uncharacterized protein n=1 Tax=Naganishia cerealis TaxID=610337 RepID=A0ACC2VPB5_9TREE|nr:hypothetical protein QFC19_005479 [Naganishia cerealis]